MGGPGSGKAPGKDLTGIRFGKLVVMCQFVWLGRSRCRCLCDCGKELTIIAKTLLNGMSNSCGCTRAELIRKRSTVHGCTPRNNPIPEYMIWLAMKKRCNNPNDKSYKDYGGRGITVCKRWNSSFQNFIDDMGRRPNPSLSLDRRKNDEGYSPENCQWATRSVQNSNRRKWGSGK